ncbi:hypothetical protein K493DRAFT_295857 [Basidiobolus meristosporus CBS 931.73]|uniref:L-type lectin-like domain-containing protein n=1 Tax=Basidiobolus meristosporus CBS 931.73 TaxID=1314790 RepID=A0A1Y1Z8Y3_9FUNG|nr:hypothetical protein K493DRAFT_295857 [Basidiobolus meristosporus CBS 931.73]|eukprot:ORY06718.1 hypothetical protein K493DRAFT_295857 [Basidiobolus meristosporus CBS 931.73]
MHSKRLFTCVFTLATSLLLASKASAAEEDKLYLPSLSLHMPYIDEEMRSNHFEFGGDTVVNTYKGVQLTADLPSRAGWLWSKHALPTNSWEVEFEFKVDGHGTNIFGDGFAFWATTNDPQTGPVFGSVDRFEGLGVFFDTYANAKHPYSFPYVSAMIGDGKTSYDVDQDGEPTRRGGCEADFRGKDFPTKARVSYSKGQYVQVQLQSETEGKWTDCFTIDNAILPSIVYLGFSAHTGEISGNVDLAAESLPSDSHEIISISSHSIKRKDTYQPSTPQPVRHESESIGFFWKLAAILTVGGLIYYVYQKNQRNAKRF